MVFPVVTDLGSFTAIGATPSVISDGNCVAFQAVITGLTGANKVNLEFQDSLDNINWYADETSKKADLTNGVVIHKHVADAAAYVRVNITAINGGTVAVKISKA